MKSIVIREITEIDLEKVAHVMQKISNTEPSPPKTGIGL